tara:strand:+ start:194 stop:1078 length:885 start_codon:yes stop_codon:yes gene_type:complete
MIDERLKDARLVVSVSGGKDSTAMCLHLFELGYSKNDFDRVFMNTGWEHANTYKYLDELEETIGPIIRLKKEVKVRDEHIEYIKHFEDRLGFESPFVRRVFLHQSFPTRLHRWCTRVLKIDPIKDYFKELDYNFVNVVGIRKEESLRRSKMDEWEWSDSFDCWVWRPLIDWTEKDVIDIHRRFNLLPNRLYLNGSTRVGCWPCINSRKKEIMHIDEERISLIRDLEETCTKLRRERRGEDQPNATFFHSPVKGVPIMTIDEVRSWSNTARGGKQFELFSAEEPTCVRWGMCEFK